MLLLLNYLDMAWLCRVSMFLTLLNTWAETHTPVEVNCVAGRDLLSSSFLTQKNVLCTELTAKVSSLGEAPPPNPHPHLPLLLLLVALQRWRGADVTERSSIFATEVTVFVCYNMGFEIFQTF